MSPTQWKAFWATFLGWVLDGFVVGALQDRGWSLANAMSTCIVVSLLLCASIVWLGPETRGRQLVADETAA